MLIFILIKFNSISINYYFKVCYIQLRNIRNGPHNKTGNLDRAKNLSFPKGKWGNQTYDYKGTDREPSVYLD